MSFIGTKKKKLFRIYKEFNKEARKYIHLAVCKAGCADCCIDVGNIDITTLEGLVILDHLRTLPPSQQKALNQRLEGNFWSKQQRKRLRCPFLSEKNVCQIYSVRPFSCRRLFSFEVCGPRGPVLPRKLWETGEKALHKIYKLDEFGYSGHISYVLRILKNPEFHKIYTHKESLPERIEKEIRKYDLMANRNLLNKTRVLRLEKGLTQS